MSSPLVSIIMSCYNGEKFIKRSVTSILNQSYKNWELIFWNNNSNDNSEKEILNLNDNRIKYFKSQTTTLLSESRSNAIEKSSGDLIAFLDVDDLWLKKKLEITVKYFLENKNCALFFSNYYVFYSEKKKIHRIKNNFLPSKELNNVILKSYLDGNGLIAFLTVVINKKILDMEKYYFDKKLHIAADFDLILRLAENHFFVFENKPLGIYFVHGSNTTSNSLEQQTNELLICYEKIKNNNLYSEKLLNYFIDIINYNFAKVFIKKKNYINSLKKLFQIQSVSLKVKLLILFFFNLFNIKKI